MATIHIQPTQKSQHVTITRPDLPGQVFSITIPEAIGDTDNTFWVNSIQDRITWATEPDGSVHYQLDAPGELEYTATARPGNNTVDIEIALTNRSSRTWPTSHAFTCFNPGAAPNFADHELLRTYGGHQGQLVRLVEHPRTPSTRPPVQLYGVEGAPPAGSVYFVDRFHATSPMVMEGFLAIRSKDGAGVIGVASRNCLYLFNNLEYSCIHACPNFGPLEPGQSGTAFTRLYIMKGALEQFYARVKAEVFGLGGAEGEGQVPVAGGGGLLTTGAALAGISLAKKRRQTHAG